jgi:hypothetical protein
MRVKIDRLGGFAGVEENLASVDLANMPKPVGDQVQERLAQLSRLSARSPGTEGADQFYYKIEMAEPGAQPRTLTVVDEGDPNDPAIKAFMAILELLWAKPR